MKVIELIKALLIFVRNGDGEIWKVDPVSGAVLSSFQGPEYNVEGDRTGSLRFAYRAVCSKGG